MIKFHSLHPLAEDYLGLIPSFLSDNDPRSAHEQIDDRYAHGGGFHSMKGWDFNPTTHQLRYPGDPPLSPVAFADLRAEKLYVYLSGWVCVVQPDGAFEVARID